MYIGTWARRTPEKPAVIMGSTGELLTYRQLDDRSNQVAQMLYAAGLRRGDAIVLYMENNIRFLEVAWAAYRSGLYLVTVNRYLPAEDVAHITIDSKAKFVFTSKARADVARLLPALLHHGTGLLMTDGVIEGWASHEERIAGFNAAPLDHEWMGINLDYTSGTTGRPKGVLRPLPDARADELWPAWEQTGAKWGFHQDMVNLCPAPLYHGAPMRSVRATHIAGGTVVLMAKFDALEALRLIERYRVTHAQWVPTMFVRMLNLPVEQRGGFDLSSLECAVHAAAPCPMDVKRRMIDWWGPIVHEFYGATDTAGGTHISCREWLEHPGSVGKAPATLHICDDAGAEVMPGESGLIYFAAEGSLPEYLNDPQKTRESRHPVHQNWMTVGDIGYVDDHGYLFLTDRKSYTIISGGVNIYPKMIEEVLEKHPAVADVAVFGIPNNEMGEEVKAVIELQPGLLPSSELAQTLQQYVASHLAAYMIPRSFDFVPEMPRSPMGKLLKKPLRDAYWVGRTLVS